MLKPTLKKQPFTPQEYAFNIRQLLFGNGEQGAFFVPKPTVLGDQVLFQDDAGTTPVESDGDPVGLMKDLSGNDNHASQSTSSARPIYRTDEESYRAEFDGVDDSLEASINGSGDFFMCVAFKQNEKDQDANSGIMSTSNDPDKSGTFQLSNDSDGIEVRDGEGVITNIGPNDTNWHIVSLFSRNGNSYSRVDGGSETSLPNHIDVVDLLKIGVNRADIAYNNHKNAGICFVLSEVDDGLITDAEKYFAKLAGITL